MDFGCPMPEPNFNGIYSDEINVHVTKLTKEELEHLMSDPEGLKNLAKNSSQVQKSITEKEANMQENRKLAEANLSLEPTFLSKKQQLTETYARLSEVKRQYQNTKSQIDSLETSYTPSTILALIQAANAESEEKSEELANRFVNKEIDVDTFLKQFIPLRKLCNERRFKSEKLAEQLSAGRPITSSRPNLTPSVARDSARSASPMNGAKMLYPDLSNRLEASPVRISDVGFTI